MFLGLSWFKWLFPFLFLSFAEEDGGGTPTFTIPEDDNDDAPTDDGDGKEFLDALDLPLEKKKIDDSEEGEEEKKQEEETSEKREEEEGSKKGKESKEEDKEEEGKKKEESDKEEDKIDLNQDLDDATIQKLTPREKAFYYEMKKERKKRQEIEAERDYLTTQLKYGLKKGDEKKESKKTTEGTDDIDLSELLKDKEDSDLIEVGELKKVIPTLIKREVAKTVQELENKKTEQQKKLIEERRKTEERIVQLEEEFSKTHDDYEEMLNIAAKAMKDFPSLSLEVFNATQDPKGNPVEVVYNIGKKFQKIYGDETTVQKKSQNTQSNTAKKIIENAERRKTSASVSSGGSKTFTLSDLESMDREELGKFLAKLPISEYRKVPKHIREKAL